MAKARQIIVPATSEYGAIGKLVWLPYFARYDQSVDIGQGRRTLPCRHLRLIDPPYPRLPLDPDEAIAVVRAPLLYLWPGITIILAIGLGITSTIMTSFPALVLWAGIAGVLTVAMAYAWYLRWWATVWYFTATKISKRRKVWYVKKEWTLNKDDIQKVSSRPLRPQWLIGWLRLGTVTIQTSTYGEVVIGLVNRPNYVERAVRFIKEGPGETMLRERVTELESVNDRLTIAVRRLTRDMNFQQIIRSLGYDWELIGLLEQNHALPDMHLSDDTLDLPSDEIEVILPAPEEGNVGRARVRPPHHAE